MTPSAGARSRRWLLVLAAVLLLHATLLWWLGDALVGLGPGRQPMPPRIEAAFVRTLAPAEPVAVAVAPAPAPVAPKPRPRRARPPAAAASAASAVAASEAASASDAVPSEPARSEPVVVVAVPPPEPEAKPSAPVASAPETTAAAAAVAAAAPAASAASAAAPFEWPPSTRLTYTLAGNYRGEIHGNARVQWVRLGARYQVHLDVAVGPSFAPLISRNMTSDGELGDAGLMPRRYDEATKLPFQSPRRVTMLFTPETVTLANGSTREALPGVQDAASQFVHLTWLFTTQPQLLRVGNSVEVPLALPRRMDRWIYDVAGEERLHTPVGVLDTFHLKPRRAESRPRGELSAEVWFAPTLQYLPVRIRIQQDAQTFVDLVMDAAPLQAAPEGAPR
jgi:Protein of unknown function (DUF3108)